MRLWSSVPHRRADACGATSASTSTRTPPTILPQVPLKPCLSPADSLGTLVARYVGLGSPGAETSPGACGKGDVAALLLRVTLPRHSWLDARLGVA
jgi:hypothetical protein